MLFKPTCSKITSTTHSVKIYHGIIEPQHLIGPRQMVLLREWYAGLRKEPQQYCYNKDWMKNGGLILWNAFCYLRNVWDVLTQGKTPFERRYMGQKIPFGALLEYHPISTLGQSRLHQFGKEVLLGIFRVYQLIAGGIWKGDVLIAYLENLDKLDASEIYHRRREVLISQKGDEIISPVADGTTKLSDRDYDFRETTLRREQTERSADFCSELQGERGQCQTTESTDEAEAQADFWSIQGDFIYRRHHEFRVQLYVPKEETFPFPLKYIDVTRSTHTDLDVMQEKRTDDCWNVDSNRSLSDSWTGFKKLHSIERETSQRIYVGREEIAKSSNDYQTRSCMARSMDEIL